MRDRTEVRHKLRISREECWALMVIPIYRFSVVANWKRKQPALKAVQRATDNLLHRLIHIQT